MSGERKGKWTGEPGGKAQQGSGICLEQNGARISPAP